MDQTPVVKDGETEFLKNHKTAAIFIAASFLSFLALLVMVGNDYFPTQIEGSLNTFFGVILFLLMAALPLVAIYVAVKRSPEAMDALVLGPLLFLFLIGAVLSFAICGFWVGLVATIILWKIFSRLGNAYAAYTHRRAERI